MKKAYTFFLLSLLLLLAGCRETVHKESKDISGETFEFEFTLDTAQPVYYVQVQVRYSFSSSLREKLAGEIISPSGKRYNARAYLAGEKGAFGSKLENLHFPQVEAEEGTFKLIAQQEKNTRYPLKKATLTVYKE